MSSSPELSVAWSGIAVGVLALLLLLLLVPFLQRRLRVFTRGTIAFMVSALMIFTIVDGINVLNGIRNSEDRIRREAREIAVTDLFRTWISEGATNALTKLPAAVVQTSLSEGNLEALELEVEAELELRGQGPKKLSELRLAAVEVHRTGMWGNWGDHEHWDVEVLLDDGSQFYLLDGRVRVWKASHEAVRIDEITADLRYSLRYDDSYAADLYQRADHRSQDYALRGRRHGMRLVDQSR